MSISAISPMWSSNSLHIARRISASGFSVGCSQALVIAAMRSGSSMVEYMFGFRQWAAFICQNRLADGPQLSLGNAEQPFAEWFSPVRLHVIERRIAPMNANDDAAAFVVTFGIKHQDLVAVMAELFWDAHDPPPSSHAAYKTSKMATNANAQIAAARNLLPHWCLTGWGASAHCGWHSTGLTV
jgi:hypothetical protein